MTVLLEARHISKRFGGVQALSDVSFDVRAGEVLGLMGDNGAGKSTLMKTIAGAHRADSGTITIGGDQVTLNSPRDAAAAGIAVVYQDLALVDQKDVAANVFLGRELTKFGFLDRKRMRAEAEEVVRDLGVKIRSMRLPVGGMSGGQRQGVAIARAVHLGGRLVLLDEPTAALGPEQQENVLALIRRLQAQGNAVILVSHNIDHVMAVCDRILIMREGRVAGLKVVEETNSLEVIQLVMSTAAQAGE